MTRKGHLLDKFDGYAKIRKPTTTSPWAGYLRCDECGADAGKVCRDMDDLPAVEVCEGRQLVSAVAVGDDGVTRTRDGRRLVTRDDPVSQSPDAIAKRRRGAVGEPRYAPCQHCGTSTRLWGQACVVGRTWCSAPACRAAYDRQKRPPPKQHDPCAYCGAERTRGRTTVMVPACSDPECRNKAKTDWMRARRATQKQPRTSTCEHCGRPFAAVMPTRRYCGPTCRHRARLTPSVDTL